MGADITAASRARVGSPPVKQAVPPAHNSRETAIKAIGTVTITNENPEQTCQVVAVPVAAQIRLGNRKRSADRRRPEEPRVIHAKRGVKLLAVAEACASARLFNLDLAVRQASAVRARQRAERFGQGPTVGAAFSSSATVIELMTKLPAAPR